MKAHDSILVCDRFFFTEMVFSTLYKKYKFDAEYKLLCKLLENLEVDIVFLTINDSAELEKRLNRDKLPFANVAENVEESMKQQQLYTQLFDELARNNSSKPNIRINQIETSGKSQKEVSQEFFNIIEKGGKNTL